MSHLHIPDGVLPVWVWAAGLLLAAALLALAAWSTRHESPQSVAYRAALGALMLAAMSVPLGPFAYHLSLLGVVGVLLGAAGAFQVAAIVSGILALFGHGGLTVVGLNTLVLGAGAALARPVYRAVPRRWGAGWRGALATLASQSVSGLLLLAVVAARGPMRDTDADAAGALRFFGLTLPFWMVGALVEAGVAFGLMRFLERVRPGILPGAPSERT